MSHLPVLHGTPQADTIRVLRQQLAATYGYPADLRLPQVWCFSMGMARQEYADADDYWYPLGLRWLQDPPAPISGQPENMIDRLAILHNSPLGSRIVRVISQANDNHYRVRDLQAQGRYQQRLDQIMVFYPDAPSQIRLSYQRKTK